MMKKIAILVLLAVFFTGCKEKKKSDPQPASTTSSVPSTEKKQVSVKINGTEFSCSTCGNTYASGGMGGINFSEGGSNRFVFSFTGFLKPGTYPLVPFGNPSFLYEKNGSYYRGRGELTITEADTSSRGSLKKLLFEKLHTRQHAACRFFHFFLVKFIRGFNSFVDSYRQ